MSKDEPMIRYDSDQAAHRATVTGWVSSGGRWWGDDEHMARWDGCTHVICACGQPTPRSWNRCEDCRAKLDRERWEARPLVAWDGGVFCLDDGDRYFFDVDDFYEWCEDNDIQPSTVRLSDTESHGLNEVDADYWSDDLPEDGDLPDEISKALEVLNAAICEYNKKPGFYRPGRNRIVMKDQPKAEDISP